MARRQATKRIHFVRAVYAEDTHPEETFETMIRRALRRLPAAGDTEVPVASLGILSTRRRTNSNRGALRLAIGAGAPGEAMSTMGLHVQAEDDADQANAPPRDRAFKIADAFCLIEDDELLVMVDGMRIGAVETYLRQLLAQANQPPENAAFGLLPVGDPSKEDILGDEGVRSLRLSGTAFAATRAAAGTVRDGTAGSIAAMWRGMTKDLRDIFQSEARDDQQREILARHWADLNVVTTIKAKGGMRGEPAVLESLQSVGMDLIEDVPAGVNIQIVTNHGSKISPSELVLGKFVVMQRQNERNDLSIVDVWAELDQYRLDLRKQKRWGN
jgi:hypothetical protein